SRPDRNNPVGPLADQIRVADIAEIWIAGRRVSAMYAVRQQPRHILDVRDPKDVGVLDGDAAHDDASIAMLSGIATLPVRRSAVRAVAGFANFSSAIDSMSVRSLIAASLSRYS